jgi:hypothetical protein
VSPANLVALTIVEDRTPDHSVLVFAALSIYHLYPPPPPFGAEKHGEVIVYIRIPKVERRRGAYGTNSTLRDSASYCVGTHVSAVYQNNTANNNDDVCHYVVLWLIVLSFNFRRQDFQMKLDSNINSQRSLCFMTS